MTNSKKCLRDCGCKLEYHSRNSDDHICSVSGKSKASSRPCFCEVVVKPPPKLKKSKTHSTYSADYSKSASGKRTCSTAFRDPRKCFGYQQNMIVNRVPFYCGSQNHNNCSKQIPSNRNKLNGLDPVIKQGQNKYKATKAIKSSKRLNKFTTPNALYEDEKIQGANIRNHILVNRLATTLPACYKTKNQERGSADQCSGDTNVKKSSASSSPYTLLNSAIQKNSNNYPVSECDDDWDSDIFNSPWIHSDESENERTTIYKKSYPPLPSSAYRTRRPFRPRPTVLISKFISHEARLGFNRCVCDNGGVLCNLGIPQDLNSGVGCAVGLKWMRKKIIRASLVFLEDFKWVKEAPINLTIRT